MMMPIVRHHFRLIDSTNTWSKQNCHLFPKNALTVVTADEQSTGRGRWKRAWISPPFQSIYATFIFFLPKFRDDIGNIPQILAVAAAELLNDYKISPQIKWPNDLNIGNKKIGGILCETVFEPQETAVILGIGLNINTTLEELNQIDRPATSLFMEIQRKEDVYASTDKLIENFVPLYEKFQKEGFSFCFEKYKNYFRHVPGDHLSIYQYPETFQGVFQSLNADGSITCQLSDGTLKIFSAGEII